MVGPEARNFRAQWLLDLRRSLPVPKTRLLKRGSKPYPTQDEMLALMAEHGIVLRDRTEYNKLETGRNALSDELAEQIAAAFEVPGPTKPAPRVSETERLILAIHAQTDAINRLVTVARPPETAQERLSTIFAQIGALQAEAEVLQRVALGEVQELPLSQRSIQG